MTENPSRPRHAVLGCMLPAEPRLRGVRLFLPSRTYVALEGTLLVSAHEVLLVMQRSVVPEATGGTAMLGAHPASFSRLDADIEEWFTLPAGSVAPLRQALHRVLALAALRHSAAGETGIWEVQQQLGPAFEGAADSV